MASPLERLSRKPPRSPRSWITGLPVSEIVALRPADVNLGKLSLRLLATRAASRRRAGSIGWPITRWRGGGGHNASGAAPPTRGVGGGAGLPAPARGGRARGGG